MKYIRRSILREIADDKRKQKAVALALCLKEKSGNSSVIRSYTPHKVARMVGVHRNTAKKYISILIEMNLAEITNGDLFIKRMVSGSKHRNIDISAFTINTTKNIYHQIRDLLFLLVQAGKDFIRRLLRLRKDPPQGVDFKKVRRLSKKCCGNPDAEYEERGLSYKTIAKRIGCCTRTAVKVVKDAIRRKWCEKTNHCERHYLPNVWYAEIPGYTFTTIDYGFIIKPNTYDLSPTWTSALNLRKEVGFLMMCKK